MIDRFIFDRIGQLSLPFSNLLRPARFSTSSSHFAKKKMPPKKTPVQEKRTLLGRPGNNLKVGIVGLFPAFSVVFFCLIAVTGLPNVGKSSFFNVLSETGKRDCLYPAGVRAYMC